jgi:amino acid permease
MESVALSKRPSDMWPMFTDSNFEEKHLNLNEKRKRTSTFILTTANLVKMYVGISFISVPKSIAEAGIYASIVGFIYVVLMNIFCVYILLKARNRFKRQ